MFSLIFYFLKCNTTQTCYDNEQVLTVLWALVSHYSFMLPVVAFWENLNLTECGQPCGPLLFGKKIDLVIKSTKAANEMFASRDLVEEYKQFYYIINA